MNYDNINITGNISKISNEDINNYIWFDICKNEKYKDKDGEIKTISSFFSARIKKEKIEGLDFFKIGAWVNLYGIPKSYIDKEGNKKFYIFVLEIKNRNFALNNNSNSNEIIFKETDENIIWQGKMHKKEPINEETKKELKNIIDQYKEDTLCKEK